MGERPSRFRRIDVGVRVRTLTELVGPQDVIPEDVTCMIIGYEGEQYVLEFQDPDTGEYLSVNAEPWEVRA